MSLTLVTAPTAEPLTLAEAKAHLRITDNNEDGFIADCIKAGREYAETVTKRALMTQTWDWTFDDFPLDRTKLEVPKPPLSSVTSIKYYDTNGTQQTWSSTNYLTDTPTHGLGIIGLAYNAVWPCVQPRAFACTIRFVCGYSSAANVPYRVKRAIAMLTAHQWANREPLGPVAELGPLAMTVDELLRSGGWGFHA